MPELSAHPFDVVRRESLGDTFALLYSGMHSQGSGEQSFLAHSPEAIIENGDFNALTRHPEAHEADNTAWFGYAGYEMLHALEDVPPCPPSFIDLPTQFWFRPKEMRSFRQTPESQEAHVEDSRFRGNDGLRIKEIRSNLTTARYLDIVRRTIARIHDGEFYQANITRKFYGEFDGAPDTFTLFERLCALSPSPYSAYIQFGDTAILSSSPEGFLHINADGIVLTRPIKGSGALGDAALTTSEKDRAENLMIVDLMRNDLSRACLPESIRVEALHEIHDFATIRQMISTISGKRRPECSALDVINACFPPGSMTGAPKVAAMRWIAAQEQMQRGAYSGALGWIDPASNTADLSVVIRTLIIQGNRFEFQVGGGIVADSVPEAELEETLLKARAICKLLGIEKESLLRA